MLDWWFAAFWGLGCGESFPLPLRGISCDRSFVILDYAPIRVCIQKFYWKRLSLVNGQKITPPVAPSRLTSLHFTRLPPPARARPHRNKHQRYFAQARFAFRLLHIDTHSARITYAKRDWPYWKHLRSSLLGGRLQPVDARHSPHFYTHFCISTHEHIRPRKILCVLPNIATSSNATQARVFHVLALAHAFQEEQDKTYHTPLRLSSRTHSRSIEHGTGAASGHERTPTPTSSNIHNLTSCRPRSSTSSLRRCVRSSMGTFLVTGEPSHRLRGSKNCFRNQKNTGTAVQSSSEMVIFLS